jgi:hypothetical protein
MRSEWSLVRAVTARADNDIFKYHFFFLFKKEAIEFGF